MTQILPLLLFTVVLAAVSCHGEYGHFYCGRRLATTLAYVCDDAPFVKRTSLEPDGVSWQRTARHLAMGLSKSKRQVVSECCEKPCTIDELMSYCPNG